MVKRERTATPLQALAILNDIQYVEAARVLAERLIKDMPAAEDERLRTAFRLCTSHSPSESQLLVLKQLRDDQKARFGADREAAGKLIATGEFARDPKLDPVEHAALTVVIQTLFNYDPFETKR